MILDERLEFADELAIPTSAGTALAGDVIDLRSLGGSGLGALRDIGNGQTLYWYASIDVAAAGGTSMQLQLVSSAAATLTSPNIHAVSAVFATADMLPGTVLVMIAIPLEGVEYLRYLGIRTVVVGTMTDGFFSSGLTLDPIKWQAYAEGDN